MFDAFEISKSERNYLRELTKKYLDYASLPLMEERKQLWYAHNSLKGSRPVIVMEQSTFEEDILPVLKCESRAAKNIERYLMRAITNHELINDDKVISPCYEIFWDIDIQPLGVEVKRKYAKDGNGRRLGFSEEHPIMDLRNDFHKLKPSAFKVDRDHTYTLKNFVEDILGDILPVKIKNNSLDWYIAPSQRAVHLMGLETMMYSMVDYPEETHALYQLLSDDIMDFVKWQEKEGLLTLNNENDYAGAGSYGFTRELPTDGFNKTGIVTTKDIWANMNSQETVGISPEMYGEYIFPYYCELAKNFGLLYYGCCEPVDRIWTDYISKLPNLRKVSVSAWCDEDFMGDALRGSNVIFSRKPSPNYIGVDGFFDESRFSAHISNTLKAAAGCKLEFIFRDIYALSGDIAKPGRAVAIVRDLIEKM